MKKRKPTQIFMALAAAAWAFAVSAQIERSLKFIPEKADFGTIRESDGPVSITLKAVNVSPDSTFIISARTSCGCSEAQYDARMIAPGDSTTVTVSYDPTNRPGKFNKSAKIFTGKERNPNSFKITGNVIPSAQHLDRTYPEKAGPIRLSTRLANAGNMHRTESRPIFIGLYNDSDRPVPVAVFTDSEALDARVLPDTIQPFGIATISLMMKGKRLPAVACDFTFHATLTGSVPSDTIISIPVTGAVLD